MAFELPLDLRNQAERLGVLALRDQVVEIFLVPTYPIAELTRIFGSAHCRRLRRPFVIERFLDFVQAPRASRSQTVNEVGIGFVTRYAFGVANERLVKRREIFAFDERF